MRGLLQTLVVALFGAPFLSAACQCVLHYGVCDETKNSDVVFIGAAETVAPRFLDPYARNGDPAPAAEITTLQHDPSPEALAKLKGIYLKMFAGLPDRLLSVISISENQAQLQSAVEDVQSEGRVAHFRVREMFKNGDDDDKPAPQSLDIWTSGGECGIDFQAGETYLVYAVQDEDSGKLETGSCMRTRRLSEEKGDLAYLYFLKNDEAESTRLEGFVSTTVADQSVPRYEDAISTPSPGATVELDVEGNPRYSQSDADGRFFFDGLRQGDYKLSLIAPGFPLSPRTVLSTRTFHAEQNSCPRQILVAPKP
jgi:hypothetical protein